MGIIRTLLAISVIVAHSTPILGFTLVGGSTAVQAFYIISGFYMALILNEKYVSQEGSYQLFITNRLMRLYPVYWVVLVCSILIYYVSYQYGSPNIFRFYAEYFSRMDLSTQVLLMFENTFILFMDFAFYFGLDEETGTLLFTRNFNEVEPAMYLFSFVPQAWTISVEITFYLIAPFLVRRNLLAIGLVMALSIGLRMLLYTNGLDHAPWTYQFFPTELVFFMLGVISYRLYRSDYSYVKSSKVGKILFLLTLTLILLYQFAPEFVLKKVVLYLVLAASLPSVFNLFKSNKRDRFIGELSYPIYISHKIVLFVVSMGFFPKVESVGTTCAIVSILVSMLLLLFIINPIEKFRQRRVIAPSKPTAARLSVG